MKRSYIVRSNIQKVLSEAGKSELDFEEALRSSKATLEKTYKESKKNHRNTNINTIKGYIAVLKKLGIPVETPDLLAAPAEEPTNQRENDSNVNDFLDSADGPSLEAIENSSQRYVTVAIDPWDRDAVLVSDLHIQVSSGERVFEYGEAFRKEMLARKDSGINHQFPWYVGTWERYRDLVRLNGNNALLANRPPISMYLYDYRYFRLCHYGIQMGSLESDREHYCRRLAVQRIGDENIKYGRFDIDVVNPSLASWLTVNGETELFKFPEDIEVLTPSVFSKKGHSSLVTP